MKDETREFIIPVRMTFAEKEKIKARAKKTGKTVSEFIRSSALGCELKEKPDEKLFRQLIKEMRDIERAIRNLGREAHNLQFINEKELEEERKKWSKFIIETKERFL